jgi:hypothetical protein
MLLLPHCPARMLLMASKVPACAELARAAVQQQGMCVVIGLQSTGEANMNAVSSMMRWAVQAGC